MGETVLWHWNEFFSLGEHDFYVRCNQFNAQKHFFSVETMQGHPLRGHRYWQVRRIGSLIRIETGAAEKPNTWLDRLKSNGVSDLPYLSGRWYMEEGWTRMLHTIAGEANTPVVNDETEVDTISRPAMPWIAKKVVSGP